jgi:hypothetical protein
MIAGNAELQREIKMEKAALLENLSELEHKAHELTDWRTQVAKHPWQVLGAAVATGVVLGLIVGRGRPRGEPSSSEVSNRADQSKSRGPSHPVIDRVVNAVVGVAAAQAMELLDEVVPGFGGVAAKKTNGKQRVYSNGNEQNV